MLTDSLSLNVEQQMRIKAILEKMRQEIDEINNNVRGVIADIKQKGDMQIMNILTPEQQNKFKALQKRAGGKCGYGGPEQGQGPMKGHGPGGPEEELPSLQS